MELKKIMGIAVLLGAITSGATTASAKSEAYAMLTAQYPNSGASCFVCHTGSPGSMTAFGSQYKSNGGDKRGTLSTMIALEGLDSDSDGIKNILEFRTATDVNVSNAVSGIKATSTAGDVIVSGSSVSAVSLSLVTGTDLYTAAGITLASGQEILGGVSATLTLGTAGPVTISYEDAASGTVRVYEVGNATVITPTVNGSGSLTFTPASATPTVFVERTTPAPVTTTTSNGCMTEAATTPLMILFALLGLGFFARRKNA
ncbi:MAG: hypothetical protein AUK35_00055 [Zetaproteobacteria bacterium CG2_30_46_52]|nr:MAG: hypothetical protein AUK35_00055 [Zetaproteobacteria bacterium CG2_30_46_52]